VEPSEDDCESSDDEEDSDEQPGQRSLTAASSSQDTSLLHRHRGGVGLPTAFNGLADLRDLPVPADRGHQRVNSGPSRTSDRSLCQSLFDADDVQGVDNGVDATTYF